MNKVLVVVYSYTGTSRRVAQLLCSQQGWRLEEIAEVRARRGASGRLRCLLDSLFRRRPRISYDGPPPRDFDVVVLVSPIWGLHLAGPMRSFVARRRDHLPEVAVVSVMGGRGAPNAVAEIGRIVGRAPILSTAFTKREVDNSSFATRLQAFGTAVRGMEIRKPCYGRSACHPRRSDMQGRTPLAAAGSGRVSGARNAGSEGGQLMDVKANRRSGSDDCHSSHPSVSSP